ncbi:MAG: hypothetical protein HUU46_06655 [Candidatus Hydrogenedentes bacterium]|nr:hypothetical protein [Candidatus Hydrogenedentota bacterium]
MAAKKSKPAPFVKYHRDGTVWAKGQTVDGAPVGYWEWFRKDGVIMRSGYFDENGAQTGEWTTYNRNGDVYKVTSVKSKPPRPKRK